MARNTKISLEKYGKYINLGLNITYYRKREGMTQDQLAERVGISRSYLGEIEAPNYDYHNIIRSLIQHSRRFESPRFQAA